MTVPNIPRLQLGHTLRGYREERDLTQEALGQAFEGHGPKAAVKVSQIEAAKRSVSEADLTAMMKLLDLSAAECDELRGWNKQGSATPWWAKYRDFLPEASMQFIAYEWSATEIISLQGDLVPGFLQTMDYAEELFGFVAFGYSSEEVQLGLNVRKRRRDIFNRETPARVEVVLLERVFTNLLWKRETFRQQLVDIMEAAEANTITLRIIPTGTAIFYASLTLYDVPCISPLVSVDIPWGVTVTDEPLQVTKMLIQVERCREVALSSEDSKQLLAEKIKECS